MNKHGDFVTYILKRIEQKIEDFPDKEHAKTYCIDLIDEYNEKYLTSYKYQALANPLLFNRKQKIDFFVNYLTFYHIEIRKFLKELEISKIRDLKTLIRFRVLQDTLDNTNNTIRVFDTNTQNEIFSQLEKTVD